MALSDNFEIFRIYDFANPEPVLGSMTQRFDG
jgi:hypothetical protein